MTSLALVMPAPPAFSERIWRINWGLVLVLSAIAGIGVLALYSAAGGRYDPWAARHAIRYGAALGVLLVVALIHPGERGLESKPREFVTDPTHDWGAVLAQDFFNLGRVQAGMHQRGIKATRLAGYQEKRIYGRFDEIDRYFEAHDPARS